MEEDQALKRYKHDSLPISKPRDDHDGPKGLLLGYEHVVLHVRENSRLEEETYRGDRGSWCAGGWSSPQPGLGPTSHHAHILQFVTPVWWMLQTVGGFPAPGV